ncbi:TetR/AcrR family transcriptional regulator [Actinomycetospora chibensis]|uniref:TetR/AcrR family transcriptional regulator n=1 Tax=Actinomycetospora chibensis TaxID=663606 RepID=A0ABV9RD36_9PSEU|nr:TetR/AcrR family transcriptional regulator [Actinomycetospora chibensis]MDD7925060.1 TetR/AcrR family transcriptional regulator [Actinomycetospora chibensis]
MPPRSPRVPGTGDQDTKSARTRRRILESAAHVLSRRGYAGTRMAEIADLADLRLPAIYYYFPTRDAIVEEVTITGVRRTREHVVAALDALDATATPTDRICTAASAHLEMLLRESDFAAAAMRNAAQLPEELRAAGLAEERRYGELWRELFAEAARAGELDAGLDPRGARMLVLGALNWAPDWWDPARGTLDDIQETARRLVRNALGGPCQQF